MDFSAFTLDQLQALHRLAKDPRRGLLPWFRNPHAMRALRMAMEDRMAPVVRRKAA